MRLPTQLLSRMLTYAGAGATLASRTDWVATWGSLPAAARSIGLGALTLAHVFCSYVGFSALSAGVSMSLFYTYPIWNLLGAKFLYGEPLPTASLPYLGAGLLGTYLLSTGGAADPVGGVGLGRVAPALGVAAALGAAVTESGMYFAVRGRESETPWASMLELYGGALVLGLAGWLMSGATTKFQWSAGAWATMLGFNLLVGFAGYALRFYAIPKVATEAFSYLSFVGVFGSFLFGYLFAGERPGRWALLGALLVAVAVMRVESLPRAATTEMAAPTSPNA